MFLGETIICNRCSKKITSNIHLCGDCISEISDYRTPLEAAAPKLYEVCINTLKALKSIKENQRIDPFYLDTLIAIIETAIAAAEGKQK